jgi:hypothetical protein
MGVLGCGACLVKADGAGGPPNADKACKACVPSAEWLPLPKQVAPGDHYGEEASTSGREKRPTGRVVGIIRRSWRARGYAGSLQPDPPGARAGPKSPALGSSLLRRCMHAACPLLLSHSLGCSCRWRCGFYLARRHKELFDRYL